MARAATDSPDRLLLACAIGPGYAPPLAAMLRSCAEHLAPGSSAEVHAVDFGLSAEDRGRVERSLPDAVRVAWRPPYGTPGGTLPTWGRMSVVPYQKLSLADWLPANASRAIWLDADLLVETDLSRLWRLPLEGRLLLAVQDPRVPTVSSRFGVAAFREMGLPAQAPYFNAGVMLIDLDAWRRAKLGQRAFAYVDRARETLAFWDQEALNAVVSPAWGPLDPRWNWDPVLARLRALPLAARSASTPADAAPWIVHFTGSLKPWVYRLRDPWFERFFDYLDRTAWSGWRPPVSLSRSLVGRYATSPFRRWLLPLEALATTIALRSTRSQQPNVRLDQSARERNR